MRKLLLPIALFLAGILVLVAAVYWYDHQFGSVGGGPTPGYH
jgi:ABC-type transporter Mla subunit MlaD